MAIEPCYSDYAQWNLHERSYIETIRNHETLHQALDELFSRHNEIGILDYQLPEEIYDRMLLLPNYRNILLKMRNLLQSIVSGLIAEQTGLRQVSDSNPERRSIDDNPAPLSLEQIAEKLEFGAERRRHHADVVSRKPTESRFAR